MSKLTILKDVFNPYENTYSAKIILNNLENLESKTVLDMGCGSGILGIESINKGAKRVTFVDKYEKCLINTYLNLKKITNFKNYDLIKSNLLEDVTDKYDIILANLPISSKYWNLDTFTIYEKFLKALKNNIKKESSVYLTHSSFGNPKRLKKMINNESFLIKKEITETMFDIDWKLYIFSYKEQMH